MEKYPILYCAICKKEMTDKYGTSCVGISITVGGLPPNPESLAFQKKQLGKYEFGKPYQFCYECWLDSLFGK